MSIHIPGTPNSPTNLRLPRAKVIHYAGEVRTPTTHVAAGWAACCSGDRARKIKAEGRNTYEPERVTCKRCLDMIRKGALS